MCCRKRLPTFPVCCVHVVEIRMSARERGAGVGSEGGREGASERAREGGSQTDTGERDTGEDEV